MKTRPKDRMYLHGKKTASLNMTERIESPPERSRSMYDNGPLEPQRILIVDDDPSILSLLSQFMTHLGYQFRAARDGIEALEMLERAPSTIIITDLRMPRLDGIQLIKRVKQKWTDTDVIVITGYSRKFSYTDVIRAGASDFVQKPFNLDEIEAKLNRIIRERNLRARLMRLSVRDCLTDLYNRRFFDQRIKEEIERATRQCYPLFLIMLDLDNFKHINDMKGHRAGDEILRILARVLKRSTRNYVDTVFRYGGDEFAIIIPQATLEQAEHIAERVRLNYLKEKVEGTSLSIGVASFDKDETGQGDLVNILVQRADEAMYAAKKAGGNRVVVYARQGSH